MKIGIDLGGSHIAIGLVEKEKVLQKIEYDFTEKDKSDLENVLTKVIKDAISTILQHTPFTEIEMIGISVPGRPKDGYIREAANIKAKNINIAKIVKDAIDKPIYMMNDGMCAAIAEKEYGSLKNYKNGVFLGLGTGVGTAVFIHNQLVPEVRSAGHMIIEKNGRKCNCGKNGCYETYASMKAFKTSLRKRLGNEHLTSREILEQLKNPEKMEQVEDIIKEYIEYVAIGVSNFARICSAQVLVIGGSFVHYKDILFKPLLKELDRIMIPMEKEMTEIKLATLGNDAGIIGATKINKYISYS